MMKTDVWSQDGQSKEETYMFCAFITLLWFAVSLILGKREGGVEYQK